MKKQYFSSVSLRIRKEVKMTTRMKTLSSEIALLNEECAKLEDEVRKREDRIRQERHAHECKMEVL